MANTFDTLQTARTLEGTGLPREQAEAVAEAILSGRGDLATKADLRAEMATAVNRMLPAQLAMAGVLFAALNLL